MMKCSEVRELAPRYLDSDSLSLEIQSHLADCPPCARVVSDIWNLDRRVKAAVMADAIDTRTVDSLVMRSVAPPRRRIWPWGLGIAAAAAAVVISIVGATPAHKPSVLFTEAAEDHRDEVVNHVPRRWRMDRVSTEKLTATRNVPISVVDALGKAGFTFKGARICKLDGLLFVHLVYLDGGKDFSVFVRNEDGGEVSGQRHRSLIGKPVYTSDSLNQHVAGFTDGKLKALVVTNESDEAALRIARAASKFL